LRNTFFLSKMSDLLAKYIYYTHGVYFEIMKTISRPTISSKKIASASTRTWMRRHFFSKITQKNRLYTQAGYAGVAL